ncbi:MAG: N-acetylmuramoyl-L-alanine amidase [Bacteriovoracia bacterium]
MRILPASSPNFSGNKIEPEFVVLHYTACDLERALAIFANRESKVCAHFVLAPNGDLYDYGNFWEGPIFQGAHAGDSHYELAGKRFERLNANSIGVEIVNLNGNLFPYSDPQYESLGQLLRHFAQRFPQLGDPERIIGHEHIAGFRGKVDPGLEFDWNRVFRSAFSGPFPRRSTVLTAQAGQDLRVKLAATPEAERTSQFWSDFSADLERQFGRKS